MQQNQPMSVPISGITAKTGGECRLFPLPSLALIRATGEDRLAFLHGQLTRDLHNLETGRAGMAAWCNPKGRVIASLLLIHHPDHVDLLIAANLREQVFRRMQMFVLRSQVTLTAPDDSACIGIGGGAISDTAVELLQELAPQSWSAAMHGNLTLVQMPGPDPRVLVYGPAADIRSLQQQCEIECRSATESEWMLLNIETGLPWIDAGVSEQFLPQMLNLEQIGGLDFNKGCYPGQEVIARLHYRGEVKQRLRRGTSEQALEPGAALYTENGERAGTIVNSAAGKDGRWHCLAVAGLQAVRLHLNAGGGPVVECSDG